MSRGQATAAHASQAGISRSYLTQLEIGIRERMRPPAYTALRTALGLAPDDEQLLAKSEGRKPDEVT
jgi:transcriptional regulator with XRE-family HTH domain